jgi:hypothetical protein
MAFVRVGQFKAKKGSADELCRTYSAEAIPAIRAANGNAGALLLRQHGSTAPLTTGPISGVSMISDPYHERY